MSRVYKRKDRTARLLKIQMLLSEYPDGLKIEEIARKCAISIRTIYRDMEALESELNVPIWEQNSKRGIDGDYFLPAISFTLGEALNIFMSARLMQNYSHLYNPDSISAFMKLNTIIPEPLRKQVQNTIECMENKQRDEIKLTNYNKIVQAWLSQHCVKIKYQTFIEAEPVERIIDPYFIEPSSLRCTPIVICYCHLKKSLYAYNIDGIIGDVVIEPDTYEIPHDFNITNYLNSAWDTYIFDGEVENIKLHFNGQISKQILLIKWHPSQKVEFQSDGSAIVTLKTRNSIDLRAWILGWGDNVEVLEPDTLRNLIIQISKSTKGIYDSRKLPLKPVQSDRNKVFLKSAEITDKEWKLIRAVLPPGAHTGRPRVDDRATINGIMWVLRNGSRWSDIPRIYGSSSTCYSRFRLWEKQGVWSNIEQIISSVRKEPASYR